MKRWKSLTAALCAAVLLCGFSTTAYAGGGEYEDYGDPTMETPAPEPEPTIEPGQGFSEEGGFVTRDLLYDENTNKQFITVQTKGGETFYVVIDYDKPTDEDGEQYEAFFLNPVDAADLTALLEGGEAPACACVEKCAAGAVNTACPLCAVNMSECAGRAPEPVEPEPTPEPEPQPEPEQGGGLGSVLLILAVAVVGGGAGWYFKIYRPKRQAALDAEDDGCDDTPPWDEDEPEDQEPGEGDEE